MAENRILSFAERFNELVSGLVARGTQRVDIARTLGVSKQTISAWTSGKRSPKRPMIAGIAQAYDVSISWLHGFDVPQARSAPTATADERAKEFVSLFSKLSEEQQKMVIQSMRGILAGQ